MKNDIIKDIEKIQGRFRSNIFFTKKMSGSDRMTIAQILMDYSEEGLLNLIIDEHGEIFYIHPKVEKKIRREQQIDHLLEEESAVTPNNTNSSIPLPIVEVLGMIDARRLNLSQLKQKLDYDDERKVKKWLDEHGIPLHKDGREKVVYEFNIDLAIQLELIRDLKKQYPDNWHMIYAANSSCERMTKAVFKVYPPKAITADTNKVKTPKKFLK